MNKAIKNTYYHLNSDEKRWYQRSVEETFSLLSTEATGLTKDEVDKRLVIYGHNEVEIKKRSALVRFLLQFHNPLIYVLMAAAFVTAILNMWTDTTVILLSVVINVIVGFIQEGKAESAIESLNKMMVPQCTVLRENEKMIIPSRELVPGDIVFLESGNRVPADLRLFYVRNLSADESILTGESVPVNKDIEPIIKDGVSLADQRCIAFSGTFIARGSGEGIVIGTGEKTEFGKIAKLMKEVPRTPTPLMRKTSEFTRFLVTVILIATAINFILGVVLGYTTTYSFLASVALIVAATPETLPALVVAILSLSAMSMAKRNAIIRRLPAAETLGVTTVIASDKTGTLTKNEMTVERLYCGGLDYRITGTGYAPKGDFILDGKMVSPLEGPIELKETLMAGYLCNNATLTEGDDGWKIVGDPTEGALVVSARKAGLKERSTEMYELPFEPDLQHMATLHKTEDGGIIYVKGSPEKLLEMCQDQLIDGGVDPLRTEEILAKADDMGKEGLRVLAMAYRRTSDDKTTLSHEDVAGLTFLGLQGMIDPPKDGVIEAIRKCKSAGIKPIMITGDRAKTAVAIAHMIGVMKEEDKFLTGAELSSMSDEELYEVVEEISVYARASPEHKLRITRQLRKKGHVVAVTGDGVNDAPALKAADIGVAMGLSGTEVSKEAADMVLADDNFTSIVAAVEEGRHGWNNFQKAVLYTLPTSSGQALLIMGAVLLAPFIPLFAISLPLEPIHILWVNLADSVFLTLPLMMEPKEKGLLRESPRDPKEKIANRLFFVRVGLASTLMALTAFAIYYHFGGFNSSSMPHIVQAQTATFVAVILFHLGYLISARSIYDSAFTFSPFSNRWVLFGIGITLLNVLLITYIPPLQAIFRTAAFPVDWWRVIILALLPGFFGIETEKYLRKRVYKRGDVKP